jgi:parvulin-like peptidyl-prolyl isomerase
MAAYREQIRRGLVVQKYMLSKKKSDIDGIHAPTEEDIIGYYNANRTEFTRPETVRFSMILVKFGDNRTESRSRIDRLAVELGGNAQKFDEAVMKSRAAGSTLGYQGGDAGYLPRNAQSMQVMGTELVNLAFTLRVNEVSRVLETPQGFVIVKVTETYPIKILEMDDVYQLGYGLSVHDYIGRGILQMRQQQTLARIQQELVAELRTGNPFQIIEANLNW